MSSIAARYVVKIYNQEGEKQAEFESFASLECSSKINDLGVYRLSFDNYDDDRFDLFALDGKVEVCREVPGANLAEYVEFVGLHRKFRKSIDESGRTLYSSEGVDLNDLLARTNIAYNAGTIRADKDAPSETAMKEYVVENCGVDAEDYTVVGRFSNGYLPGFSVEADQRRGVEWSGSRSGENLLEVLRSIAEFSKIDFAVEDNGPSKVVFKTFIHQMGSDRTRTGLNFSTGKNAYGNVPVIFSLEAGTASDFAYGVDRLNEITVVHVLGPGDVSLRVVFPVLNSAAIADSPWNRREAARPGGNQEVEYQFENVGKEILAENAYKEEFSFSVYQQPSLLYGLHYFLGDRVVGRFADIERNKKIVGVNRIVTGSEQKEKIAITLSDAPTVI